MMKTYNVIARFDTKLKGSRMNAHLESLAVTDVNSSREALATVEKDVLARHPRASGFVAFVRREWPMKVVG